MKHNRIRGPTDTYTLPLLSWQQKIENNIILILITKIKVEVLTKTFLTGKAGNNTEAKFLDLTDI